MTDGTAGVDPPAGPADLPPLPLQDREPTRDTLHLIAQIVGKIRLASTPRRNPVRPAPCSCSGTASTWR